MTFLTNRPLDDFKEFTCKLSGWSFDELDQLEIPKQVVLDISNEYPTRALLQIVQHFGCQYIESLVEINSNNVVYFIQEAQRNIIKIEAL